MGEEGERGSLERGALEHRCYEGEAKRGSTLTAEEEWKKIHMEREADKRHKEFLKKPEGSVIL